MLGDRTRILLVLALLPACPAKLEEDPGAHKVAKPTDDPRVIEIGGDLYAAERYAPEPKPAAGRGSGAPDESNGRCRLYAPKLPEPECCSIDLGFDVPTVLQACDMSAYVGESFHFTCGHYFHKKDGRETWFRISVVQERTPKQAAQAHDTRSRRALNDPTFTSSPIPGVPDAYWSGHGELNWAFIPGWSRVRGLGWHTDACSREGVVEILKQLIATPEPADLKTRAGLVPTARK